MLKTASSLAHLILANNKEGVLQLINICPNVESSEFNCQLAKVDCALEAERTELRIFKAWLLLRRRTLEV